MKNFIKFEEFVNESSYYKIGDKVIFKAPFLKSNRKKNLEDFYDKEATITYVNDLARTVNLSFNGMGDRGDDAFMGAVPYGDIQSI